MFEWKMVVRYRTERPSAATISGSLWKIVTALESVDGVAVELEDWGRGSFVVKLRILLANLWAIDYVKAIVEKARKAVEAILLDKQIEDVEKTRAERLKIEEDIKALKLQRESQGDLEHRTESMELDLEIKRQDLLAKRLQNQKSKLENIEIASSLLANGLLEADRVEVDINGLCAYLCDDTSVDIGMPITRIEEAGIVLKNSKIPPQELINPNDDDRGVNKN